MNKIVILMTALFVVVLVIKFPHRMINPGPLQEAHAALDNDCKNCHQPFWGIPNANCISCHDPADIGRDTTGVDTGKILFHEALTNRSCIGCHDDHKGRIPLVAINSFDHKMPGTAKGLNCVQCHTAPEDKLHPIVSKNCASCHDTKNWSSISAFDHAMINKVELQQCGTCHQAPQDQMHIAVTSTSCSNCHQTGAWSPATFNHDMYFVLDGNHNVRCNTCHTKQDFKTYTCYGCHEHTERKMVAEHSEEGINNINDCARCHGSANEHDVKRSVGDGNSGEHRKRKEGEHEEDDDD